MTDGYTILVREFEDQFRGLGIDGRIPLKDTLKKLSMSMWTGFN
jgi:hypothetical protein